MNVFGKYLVKSIIEKKGRTFLLLISIAISSALLVASMGSIKALLGTVKTQMEANYGEFNVQVNPKQNLGVPLFTPIKTSTKDVRKSFEEVDIGGYVTSSQREFRLMGTTIEEFNHFGTMKLTQSMNLTPFNGKKLIISQKASTALKVKLGDELKLNILGKEVIYKICGISNNMGAFFFDNDKAYTFVTPEENVFSIYGEKGKYSSQLLKVDSKDLSNWVKNFNLTNAKNKITASKLFDEQQMEQQLSMVRTPLYFMLAIVLLMTTFIIYSSFKLIITERMPVIGVFLSQGATKGWIINLLLRESLAYGILGGIVGDLIGAGLTNLIANYGNPLKDFGVKATTEYYPPYFIIGFVFSIGLSLASTIIPILSIRKLPVKDVILNTLGTRNNLSMKSFWVGVAGIVIAIILHFSGSKINNIGALPALFCAFIGAICIIPKLIDVICYPIVRGFRNINGLSMLAFNNVRTSKVLINNIRLISVSVISIIMITSLSVSIKEVVKGAYKDMKFDIRITVSSNNTKDVNRILNEYKGISFLSGTGMILTNLNGDMSKNIYLNYYDPQKYKTFEAYTVWDHKDQELNLLDRNEDGIILSKQIALRYKIKKEDIVTLTLDSKNVRLKVLSIFNAKMMDSGNYNLISLKAAKKHFDINYPAEYYANTSISPDKAKKELELKLKGMGTNVITKDYMSKENEKANKQMTDVLSIFAYLTMVIGAFGIFSNVSISFIQRKRELAVISSVGMTKGGRGYMILLESIFEALIGVAVSLAAAVGINRLFEDVFKFISLDINLRYPVESIGAILLAAIMLMLITSISSIFRSKKLQIVQELKYE